MLETLIIARHAHAASNAGDMVSGIPPGEGLSAQGAEEAAALGVQLAQAPIELGASSRFRRASETVALALEGAAFHSSSNRAWTRSGSARSRGAPWPPIAPGPGRTGLTPPARVVARRAPTPPGASP